MSVGQICPMEVREATGNVYKQIKNADEMLEMKLGSTLKLGLSHPLSEEWNHVYQILCKTPISLIYKFDYDSH